MNRRLFLGCVLLLVGCGGSDDVDAPPPESDVSPAVSDAPPIVELPIFVEGSGDTFDLATMLPANVKRGGTFSVSPNGLRLPAGMTLSAAGILAVGNARSETVEGVIFMYEERVGAAPQSL